MQLQIVLAAQAKLHGHTFDKQGSALPCILQFLFHKPGRIYNSQLLQMQRSHHILSSSKEPRVRRSSWTLTPFPRKSPIWNPHFTYLSEFKHNEKKDGRIKGIFTERLD